MYKKILFITFIVTVSYQQFLFSSSAQVQTTFSEICSDIHSLSNSILSATEKPISTIDPDAPIYRNYDLPSGIASSLISLSLFGEWAPSLIAYDLNVGEVTMKQARYAIEESAYNTSLLNDARAELKHQLKFRPKDKDKDPLFEAYSELLISINELLPEKEKDEEKECVKKED